MHSCVSVGWEWERNKELQRRESPRTDTKTGRRCDHCEGFTELSFLQAVGHWMWRLLKSPRGTWRAGAVHPVWQQEDCQRGLWRVGIAHCDALLCLRRGGKACPHAAVCAGPVRGRFCVRVEAGVTTPLGQVWPLRPQSSQRRLNGCLSPLL